MPLPKPTLDNRVFDQLVREGRGLVPRLAPAWTDHNASDPGITLIELLAWLAEQNIYRFDPESDEAARAFARLVGVEPMLAGTAHTVVCLSEGSTTLPSRTALSDGAVPLFETTQDLAVSPAALVCVLAGTALNEATAANASCAGFDAFGARPRPGAALYLGFDRALDAPGRTLSLHLWTPQRAADDATRAALQKEAVDAPAGCAPPDWRRHYRVHTLWEFHAGGGVWQPLSNVVDETRAATLSGFVRFDAPIGHQPGGPGPQWFIRCRIVHGRFECPPRLAHVGFNAVPAEHALTRPERPLGDARGQAGAVFALGESPIVPGSLQLRLDDGAGHPQADWQAVADFERSGAHDRHVRYVPETGELTGGNGLRGALLPAGWTLHAAWRAGSGEAGDLPARTLAAVPGQPGLTVDQPFAATGGTPGETLPATQARAFDLVSQVDKAVTLADIERLALATPGVPVARVRAVPNHDPQLPCWSAPGVVTLIVIPPCPLPAPLPSRALLDAVERHLAPRRLVTSEIHAIAPHYRRVSVSATLHLAADADPAAVQRSASARVNAFFDPLTGGPDGNGWPFGRTLYRSELMALLADTPGVLRVTAFGLSTPADAEPRCGNVELCPHELVRPGPHALRVESDAPTRLTRSLPHECPHR